MGRWRRKRKKSIALALGGGGVRGLAHVPVLQLLDELDLRPAIMAGTSMGAVVGALYSSGMSGLEIRELIDGHIVHPDDTLKEVIGKRKGILEWVTSLLPELHRGGLVNVDRFLGRLFGKVAECDFQELKIPLSIVATDYWSCEQVVIDRGPVMPAVRASMAVPGIFAPVQLDGRVLVDGGVVNNLPYDLLLGRADVVIAVDVGGEREPGRHTVPSAIESIMGALDIMSASALKRKLAVSQPDILLHPRILDIDMLEFAKSHDVLDQSADAVNELRERLRDLGLA